MSKNLSLMQNKMFSRLFLIFSICCLSTLAFSQTRLLQSTGKLSFLRVHEVGSKYGPPSDQIDSEVIIKLNNKPDHAFGFQLRNNNDKLVRSGMLDLLRDAFVNNHTVTIDYEIKSGKKNGVIIRVALSK